MSLRSSWECASGLCLSPHLLLNHAGAPEKKKLGMPTMMPNWDKDFEAGRFCLTNAGLEIFEAPLACEGGSIHSDGEG